MNRLKKELISRGIVYENDGGYEEGRSFITITEKYIITLWGCNVLPLEIHLFDKNFKLIGKQNLFPERWLFRDGYTWFSQVFDKEANNEKLGSN